MSINAITLEFFFLIWWLQSKAYTESKYLINFDKHIGEKILTR